MKKNLDNLKKYISSLKSKTTKKCMCEKNTKNKPLSKAQNVQICKDTVIKGPKNKGNGRIAQTKNNHSIKIDNITMNLLIQTIIKKYIFIKGMNQYNIEHYTNLCENKGIIKLISAKSDYPNYNTLQDYIIKCKDHNSLKIKFIEDCLKQSFKQLDILYRDIQFHHCDCKAAQLFLFKKNNAINSNSNEKNANQNSNPKVKCMLADLDKVTFTLNINGYPYRIRLTKDKKKHTFKGIFLSGLEKVGYLDKMTEMRFKSVPQRSNLLEKITFISSCCILLNNKNFSIQLRDLMLTSIFTEYGIIQELNFDKIIKLNNYYGYKLVGYYTNKNTSLSTPMKYIDYNYLLSIPKINDLLNDNVNLKSKIYLSKINDSNHNIEVELNNIK